MWGPATVFRPRGELKAIRSAAIQYGISQEHATGGPECVKPPGAPRAGDISETCLPVGPLWRHSKHVRLRFDRRPKVAPALAVQKRESFQNGGTTGDELPHSNKGRENTTNTLRKDLLYTFPSHRVDNAVYDGCTAYLSTVSLPLTD